LTLLIAIESATMLSKVFIARDGKLIEESPAFVAERTSSEFPRFILNSSAANGFLISDIDCISVDIGPGRLSATRSGVSFANALSFSLRRPLIPLTYFELIGYETSLKTSRPIVCVVEASNGMGYVGYFENGQLSPIIHNKLLDELRNISSRIGEYCLAGQFSSHLSDKLALPPDRVYFQEMPGELSMLHCSFRAIAEGRTTNEPVEAITEQYGGLNVRP
jgi:tRNA A37 threonylcarbamoyladenosine modification protein TsaB